MKEFLTNLLAYSSIPILSAFILGLLTAISPCPLATNITAIGYIGKDLENRNRVFYSGLIYTAGRATSYTILALILYLGADKIKLSGFFQRYGENIIGPLLVLIGLVLLGIIRLNFVSFGSIREKLLPKRLKGYLDVFLLGTVFALAF
ncbi:MAG: sulfite exporter TauE/SafE family protein, partial [Bacteroidales bacterium]